jgi:hypothetical protein
MIPVGVTRRGSLAGLILLRSGEVPNGLLYDRVEHRSGANAQEPTVLRRSGSWARLTAGVSAANTACMKHEKGLRT